MRILDTRLGELYAVRIELEKREAKSRDKRVAERLRQESYGVRRKKT